uniref:hypothetical protein n=1 Tax=Paracoccus sp. TaxID=267 RepID=UPI00272D0620
MVAQNGRAVPLEPNELKDEVASALAQLEERHRGDLPTVARERRATARGDGEERATGPVAPERFGILQALLAHLLASCGDGREADLDAD